MYILRPPYTHEITLLNYINIHYIDYLPSDNMPNLSKLTLTFFYLLLPMIRLSSYSQLELFLRIQTNNVSKHI